MARTYIPVAVRRRVRKEARDRCGYCLHRQDLVPDILQIDHIIPPGKGGSDEESNLWLACNRCNGHKSDKISATDPHTDQEVPLFNPRTEDWFEHFCWSEDGLRIIGLTTIGRATVVALHLSDDPITLAVRANWVDAGWDPPSE